MNQKIGILDSGIGGTTILKEIKKLLPTEDYIYYADGKNNPYGEKTPEEIYEIVEKIVKFWVQGPDLVQNLVQGKKKSLQNGSAGRSKAYSLRRYNHFPYTSPRCRRSGHLQGTSGAQVNCTKVGTRCSGRHLMKKHLTQGTASCVNRWRTGESGLTDFG